MLNLYKLFAFFPALMQKAPMIGEFTAPNDEEAKKIAKLQIMEQGASEEQSRLFKIGTQIELP